MPRRRSPEEVDAERARLVSAAAVIVRRDGADALTMRSVAKEAGSALGLPYTYFADRQELVLELIARELRDVAQALDAWVGSAGEATVGENLDAYATILLGSDAPALLLDHRVGDPQFGQRLQSIVADSGIVRTFESAMGDYLRAEASLGRIAVGIDIPAFGFLITGALHNLVTAGSSYPRPTREELTAHLAALAAALEPRDAAAPSG